MKRRRFLRKVSLAEAQKRLFSLPTVAEPLPAEEVPTPQAQGRVTAEPIFAARSVPHYHCAAMDGIAVRAEETFGASETNPVCLTPEQFVFVDTGDPLPAGYDAVIMIEEVQTLPEGGVELIAAARPWQHIRLAGEDLVATELLLARGHRLRPVDIAALLSCGVLRVKVRRKPRFALIPTGSEIVDPLATGELEKGKIADTNSYLLAGLIAEWGGEAQRQSSVPDDLTALREALLQAAAESDAVVFIAGSSAGRADLVPALLADLGELLVHGVDLMPGKPLSLGVVEKAPVIGVPGYPVSAYVVAEQFLKPLIYRWLGQALPSPSTVEGVMGRRTASKLGQEEFVRVKVGRVEGKLVAVPLARGAGVLSSVVRADGFVRIPTASEGVEAGEPVSIELLRPLAEIEGALLAVGSHDLLLDLLADELRRRHPGWGLTSAHVGSLGGLVALKRGECHLAGTHLLDETTGEYNLPYLRRLFGKGEVALINLCYRQQGLLVAPGNPQGITSLTDLVEK
ncbi:MAG TPA: molybdopterin biosynthesis protein, partial [Armatimonadetes bacterium]|nr:molybdopterin biosynthesis protein [Armatimonadota bacterium]